MVLGKVTARRSIRWIAAGSGAILLLATAIVTLDRRVVEAPRANPARVALPYAQPLPAVDDAPPRAAPTERPTLVAASATGSPMASPASMPARSDPLPASVVRDAATGLPHLPAKAAEAIGPARTPMPAGGPANGVVTDPATGVTRVGDANASPLR